MKLLIISDTNYYTFKGEKFIFHSVQRELEVIGPYFNEIDFVGWRTKNSTPQLLKINHPNFKLSGITIDKNNNFKYYFTNLLSSLFIAYKIINSKAQYVHVRGPSFPMFIALFLAPILSTKKKFWFKFANSWSQNGLSRFWDLQKLMLKSQRKIKVTINGNWPDLPKHIIPFENPGFFEADLKCSMTKDFSQKKKVVFIGRMTESKGIFRILDALTKEDLLRLGSITFVGDGPEIQRLQNLMADHPCKSVIKIVGGQSKEGVMNILKESHFLLLPTTSPEGFPKVVAEAWLNKCIPIVSNVSSIPQYVVDKETGILWDMDNENWAEAMNRALELDNVDADRLIENINLLLPKFTYEYFGQRVKEEIYEIV